MPDKPVTEVWLGQTPALHPNILQLYKQVELVSQDALNEVLSAMLKHRAVGSLHEGHSIILEEFEEFWEEVKKKRSERDLPKLREELIQVAAMAIRTIFDVVDPLIASELLSKSDVSKDSSSVG